MARWRRLVTIIKTERIDYFVIPGLIRNPVVSIASGFLPSQELLA